ncbi:MAG: response regulator [Thermodesulfobacteriota bacterium]
MLEAFRISGLLRSKNQPKKKRGHGKPGPLYHSGLFSQERMTYLPDESKIIYRSKDNRQEKIFDALDWLAVMASPIPDQREQMVRYYGFYSNVSRGLRQKENMDGLAVLKEIRLRDSLTPVILLTGNLDIDRVVQVMDKGVATVLLKPCPIETLISSIENACESKTISREIAGKTG